MVAIEIPPGVYAAPTKASKSAQWSEVNLVRWKEGKLSPFGGWEKYNYARPLTRIRAIHRWQDNAGKEWKAFLCEGHLYIDVDGVLVNMSPTVPLVLPYAQVLAGGYGMDLYSLDDYGTPRPDRNREVAVTPCYTLDNWGEDLLIMTSPDGRLLRWKPSTPTVPAAVVPNAPLLNRSFTVTAERHVIVFQKGGDARRFGWSDQENIENWNIADVNSKAGEFDVEPSSPIISHCRVRGGILFHTAKKSYLITFVGMPYVYAYNEVSSGGTPLSAASICETSIGTIWLASSGFWLYNGSSIAPLACGVWSWMAANFGGTYSRYEAAAVNVENNSEIWFFFASKDSRYNDRYVVYNYRENWWAMGKMSRSCGVSPTYTSYPMLSDGWNVFKHESGGAYPDAPEEPWAETFTINLGGGAGIGTILQGIPDVGGEADTVRFQMIYTFQRSSDTNQAIEKKGPLRKMRRDGKVDFRSTGRDFRLRVEATENQRSNWTFGNMELTMVGRGKR